MSGLAVAAVNGAVASGLSSGLVSPVAPSAIDGFAVGTLLSGLCLVVALAPRRVSRRSRRRAREGEFANTAHNPMTPNLSGYVPATAYRAPVASSDTLADDPAELLVSVPVRSAARRVRKASTLSSADLRSNGKHRSANGVAPADRRPEAKRTSGRHAARPGVAGGD